MMAGLPDAFQRRGQVSRVAAVRAPYTDCPSGRPAPSDNVRLKSPATALFKALVMVPDRLIGL